MIKRLLFSLSLFILIFSQANLAFAEEAGETEAKEPVMYYMVTPKVMTFYQGSGKKMGYIVVEVQVVTRGQDNFDLLDLHLPLMQDALIDLFNRQDKKSVTDLSLRETLRMSATETLAAVLKEEIGKNIVENVLFTQYIFQ